MVLTSLQIYNTVIHGAQSVIRNKDILNKINVFPVKDGDTGSNLASMMRTIIQKSEQKKSVKGTLESIADAALYGARGNSGIIFAQYLSGLSESVDDRDVITIADYALASNKAVDFAYNAIETPVEGTMITVMRAWGLALTEESQHHKTITDIFSNAFKKIEIALERTKNQLEVLTKANVVDSGAKGFTYFVEGALYFMQTGKEKNFKIKDTEIENALSLEVQEESHCSDGYRFCTECLIEGADIDMGGIKAYLSEQGNSTVVAGNSRKCRVHIHTNEPAKVFDYLYEVGTIVYQKVDDMIRQEDVVKNRKSNIALITDSIADVDQEFIDKHQIHVVHLDILYKDFIFMDKLTIEPLRLLELSSRDHKLPTSSQPNSKQIENLLDYIASYYDAAIILTVSKELSGTYNTFVKGSEKYKKTPFRIEVINSKQNSGAQGLIVKRCAELIEKGKSFDDLVKMTKDQIEKSKILVQVKTLDNMIKSGRLSVKAGNIAKKIGMKPIVTLDKAGKGTLESIAFSLKGSDKKVIKHLSGLLKKQTISQYSIVHVNNLVGAKALEEKVKSLIGFAPEYITETSSIIAIGAGQGAVALSYLLE